MLHIQYLKYLLVILRGIQPSISHYVLYQLLVVLYNKTGSND